MKKKFSYCRCFRKPLLAALVLALLPPLLPAGTARAAGLAEDHTVLYYLVEMQRRFKRNCGSESMPEAPSLNPSTSLRSLAEQSAASGQSPADFARANGLAEIPFLAVTIQAGSPQDAFDRINAAQCSSLMNREYHYIGAAKNGDQWTLFLAGAEPGTQPAASGEPGLPAAPGAAELTAPGAMEPTTPVTAEPAQPAAFSAPPAQPVVAEQPAASPQPLVAAQPVSPAQPLVAAQPAAPGATTASPAQGQRGTRETYDPSPANPVPVARVTTDGLGRPVGKPEPLAPSAAPSAPYAPAPATPYSSPPPAPYSPPPAASPAPGAGARPIYVPPGGAGPVNDPAAPAAPVVVKEFEVSPTGKITGPVQPGSSAPGAAPYPGTSPQPAPGYAPPPPAVQPRSDAGSPGESVQLLNSVNQARNQGQVCGSTSMPPAPPLSFNPVLVSAAQAQADDMAARGYFSSTTPRGRTLGQRVTEAGFAWSFVAENIAAVAPPADNALRGWLANPGQCRNLMSANYTQAGTGYNAARNLWVLTLAAPAPSEALIVR